MKSYFTLAELTRSATADRLGLDNTPDAACRRQLERLMRVVLNPAREALGMPVYVNSGYRSPAVNRAVGGVPNSYHLQGRAADLDTRCGCNRQLFDVLSRLPHTELLWEQGGRWVHVAL